MVKILVTGGLGFMGSNFVRYLVENRPKDKVVVYDSLSYSGRLENLKGLRAKLVTLIRDLRNKDDVNKSVKGVDVIYHFAAESVVPDTFVPIHDSHNIRLLTIEELFEHCAKRHKIRVNGNGVEIVDLKGSLHTLSFKYGMGLWSPITRITRHKYSGHVVTLSQKWGEVTVTPNHSVYNAFGQVVPAQSNPELLAVRKINLNRSRFKKRLTVRLRGYLPRDKEGSNRIFSRKKYPAPKQVWILRHYEGETLKPLLRFLGAYVAEGWATYNRANGAWCVGISNRDKDFLESVKADVSKFSNASCSITPRKDGVYQLTFSSKILYSLVTQLCGRQSSGKRLFDDLYTLEDDYKWEFLNAYLKGDGNVEKYRSISSTRFTTTSTRLAAGMGLMLSLLDLDYTLHTREHASEKCRKSYTIRIVSKYSTCYTSKPTNSFYKGYVYDLTVDGTHNFVAGVGNIVVHNTHIDKSITDPRPFIESNITGTFNLLEAARKHETKSFIFISSSEVYGTALRVPMDEDHPTNPQSPYAATKIAGDRLCFAYHATYGMPITILRPFNNYGPRQFPEKLIPFFTLRAFHDQPLPVYGDGQYSRDYTYVFDFCEAAEKAEEIEAHGEVINIATGKDVKVIDVARMILDHLGKPKDLIEHVEDRPGHVRRLIGSHEKAKRLLGWTPRTSFKDGLKKTVDWYLQNDWWWQPLSDQFMKVTLPWKKS